MSVTADQVVQAARSYVGVKFRHQGRSRKEGLDCAGLLIRVAQDLGLSQFDIRAYERVPDGEQMRSLCDTHMRRTFLTSSGAVALIRFGRFPQHVAIFGRIGEREVTIIHSLLQFRRVCEHRLDEHWRRLICGRYEIPGVSY